VPAPSTPPDASWFERWPSLARAGGIRPGERLLLALSGGADSVLLLHLLAAAAPRPPLVAVHVHHGLRGAEADADAAFCATLCRSLGVPLALRRIQLGAAHGSLEARARTERYRVLLEEARRTGHRTVLTGHHADDALETLLQRWVRGTAPVGLTGPRAVLRIPDPATPGVPPPPEADRARSVRIVRPLLALRREEVRSLLRARGLAWREDASNADPRFTRSRIRHGLLPFLRRAVGEEGLANLRAFGAAVDRLEEDLARLTAHLAWAPPAYVAASRGPLDGPVGGVLARGDVMRLPQALRRRALWRLLVEGTGRAPGQRLLERLARDIGTGRSTRHALPGGWSLVLRPRDLRLVPPPRPGPRTAREPWLPFPELDPARDPDARVLSVPGQVRLPDGRRITAELVDPPPDAPVRRGPLEVELDAAGLPDRLSVRWPRPGDRFQGLGAPGSKRLLRFLAERGIPREERGFVPLVSADAEILWVTAVEPADARRVRPTTRARLRLAVHHDAPAATDPASPTAAGATPQLPFGPAGGLGAAEAPGEGGAAPVRLGRGA